MEIKADMFDAYINEDDPERWDMEEFPNLMRKLGFKMDCYKSFEAVHPKNPFSYKQPKEQEDWILEQLAQSDVQMVGNYIFSRFRYLTHWCDYGYDPHEGPYFFKKAFPILIEKLLKSQDK